MKLAFNIIDWHARAPGLSEAGQWLLWAKNFAAIDATGEIAKSTHLPMMTARRLACGSRLAVDCALAMLERHSADALVFASRHGELERNFRILTALAGQQSVSPTDFAMSVHNSAVGNVTIAAQMPLVSTSVCAGRDTFSQALVEVATFHYAGYARVLLVDFDGIIPEFYRPYLSSEPEAFPYAVALLLEPGRQISCESIPVNPGNEAPLTQSLAFLHGWLGEKKTFSFSGERITWQWSCS